MDKLRSDPNTTSISPADGVSSLWFGRGKHIVAYPVDFGQSLNVACTHPAWLSDSVIENQDMDTAAGYNKKVPLETVLEIFADFEPRVQHLLQLADPDGFRVWKLEDLDELGSWSHRQTVLIGDAAHATLPGAFAGAANAIEDAVTLAILLDARIAVTNIRERLQLFEELRKPRVRRIRDTGRNQEKIRDSSDDFAAYFKFLTEHDAVSHARLAVENQYGRPNES